MSRRFQQLSMSVLSMGTGLVLGSMLSAQAQSDFCQVETITFGSSPQSIMDTDDGDDEDNRWFLGGGNDFARTLACNDATPTIPTNGQGQSDDVGGGSGGDHLDGGVGNDTIRGGQSGPLDDADFMWGSGGDDIFFDAEPGDPDNASGQDGADIINLEDTDGFDNAFGGAGNDNCPVDPGDFSESCDRS